MPDRDLVVIGASAGGIAALERILPGLHSDFPAAILIVLHISPHSTGLLPDVLRKAVSLPVSNAEHGEPIRHGHIYVAPPDRHLLAGPDRKIQIGHGPKENRFRPAVDPLFRSAALNYGAGVIGIILSGGLDDGTSGLCAVKQAGGITIVQDPNDAEAGSMPFNAMRHVAIDYCLTAAKIGEALPKLVREMPVQGLMPMPDETRVEVNIAADERNRADFQVLGDPSAYTCPACNGTLMRVRNATPVRFRCHTGHAFTALTLDDEMREKVENTTWSAIRALQEHAFLLQELIQRPGLSNAELADYNARAEQSLERAQVLRETLAGGESKEEAAKAENVRRAR